jgi:hypothetical protein
MTIRELVQMLLETDDPPSARALIEASVHLSTRGKRFNASFRDETGRQVSRTTGLTDRGAALALARAWEKEAQIRRIAQGAKPKKPTIRVRPGSSEIAAGLLSQAEVGLILGVSERAVREIERRAFAKLLNHPDLRRFWREWQTGEVQETAAGRPKDSRLSRTEIAAVFALAKTLSERQALKKLIAFVDRR